jgi:tetratricopeptide (TPR) repeat protein
VAVLALAVSTALLWRAKRHVEEAKDRAEREEVRAREEAGRADAKATEANNALAREAQQRRHAEKMVALGLQTLDELFLDRAAELLPRVHAGKPEDERLLRRALDFYAAFARQNSKSPQVQAAVGDAYHRLASIHQKLGQFDQAEHAADRAVRTYRKLADSHPRAAGYQVELARAHNVRGIGLDLAGHPDRAREAHRAALAIRQRLVKRFPDEPRLRGELAATLHNLAMLHAGRSEPAEVRRLLEEAIVHQKVAVERDPNEPAWGSFLFNHYCLLGNALQSPGKLDEAEKVHREALRLAVRMNKGPAPGYTARWSLATAHANVGVTLLLARRYPEALSETTKGLALRQKLREDYPGIPECRHQLGRSHFALGQLLRDTGKLDQAAGHYRQVVLLWQQLADEFPNLRKYQDDVALASARLFRLLRARGRPAGKLEAVQHDVDVLERLVKDLPGCLELRLLLAERLPELAARLLVAGRSPASVAACRRAAAILQELPGARLDTALDRLRLANACTRVGIALRDAEKFEEALKPLHAGRRLLEPLVGSGRGNAQSRHALALACNEIGLALHLAGKLDEADRALRRSQRMREELVAQDGNNPTYRSDLGGSLNNLAHLLLTRNKPADARPLLERAIAQQRAALKIRPGQIVCLTFLRNHYNLLSQVLTALDKPAEAATALEQMAAALKDQVAVFGTVRDYLRGMAMIHHNRGMLLHQAGKPKEAEPALRAALDCWRQLARPTPAQRSDLALTLHRLALALRDQDKLSAARAFLQDAVKEQSAARAARPSPSIDARLREHHAVLAETLLALKDHAAAARAAGESAKVRPGKWGDAFRAARLLARCVPLADMDAERTDEERATLKEAYTKQVRELVRTACKRCPAEGGEDNDLAWGLATEPDPLLRNPAEAVKLARRAVERAPGHGPFWNTLGVAHYRAGQRAEAIKALEKSVKLRKGGDGYDWFFLAMAEHQSGRKKEARAWYDKAVRWMDANAAKNEALRRFRTEAAALLK